MDDDDPARLRRLVPLPPLPRGTAVISSQRRLSPSTPLPPVRFALGSGYYHAQAPVEIAGSRHARSFSQPPFFSTDFLAPHMYADLSAPAPIAFSPPSSDRGASGLPPLRAPGHRRSKSDILLGFSQPIPQMTPPANSNTTGGAHAWSPDDSSENEAESVVPRHCRSMSADSLMGSLSLGNLPPPCSGVGAAAGSLSRSGSGSISGATALFATNRASGEFNEAEKKKIANNERLAEIALTDPKRVKRILSNRVSAAKSKERKIRYMSELEHKVQVLQMETVTLTQQVTMVQRDHAVLSTQNNELKIRLRAMEQQAHLRDALNEALHSEVQRLKVDSGEISDSHMPNGSQQQISQMILLDQLQKLNQASQAHQDQQQQSGWIDAQQQQWNF